MLPAVSTKMERKIVSAETYLQTNGPKRFSRYSGMVVMRARKNTGIVKIAMKIEDQRRHQLVVRDADAALIGGAGDADERRGGDVGGKQR